MAMACCSNLGGSFFCVTHLAGGYSYSNGWSMLDSWVSESDALDFLSFPVYSVFCRLMCSTSCDSCRWLRLLPVTCLQLFCIAAHLPIGLTPVQTSHQFTVGCRFYSEMDCNKLCSIVLKYGGFWAVVKGKSRMKYVGGSQKTLKFERDDINLLLLKEQTESLCRWLQGQAYDLHYHINGTSPKVYMPINNDRDVMDMLRCSCNENKVEVVVVVKDFDEIFTNIDNIQYGDMQDLKQWTFDIGLDSMESHQPGGKHQKKIQALQRSDFCSQCPFKQSLSLWACMSFCLQISFHLELIIFANLPHSMVNVRIYCWDFKVFHPKFFVLQISPAYSDGIPLVASFAAMTFYAIN
ncbi:hypothetical protein M5K25_011322 [Dendrobium thyrsiflorum]|uniref:PB1-like domain-containing protein n=1 Tax=Dendrobium thyrsiflorum TaxID=117978 RepID=A0ABD0V2G9_DENTH